MADVFISYSRKDSLFVKKLHGALAAQQRQVWIDWEDIPPSADWWKEVCSGIEQANTFLFIISPDSVQSPVCSKEVEHAVKNNKRMVPLLHRALDSTMQSQMHPSISSHNWLYFREEDAFDSAFPKLITVLDTDLSYTRQHTRLLVRALEWDQTKRNASFLLGGDDLHNAEAWMTESSSKKPYATPLHLEYITTSREYANIRQRRLLVGVSIALAVSLFLAVLSLFLFKEADVQRGIAEAQAVTATWAQGDAEVQRNVALAAATEVAVQRNVAQSAATEVAVQRNQAQSVALAAQAQVEIDGVRPDRAVLLALEAFDRFAYTWQGERALARAIQDELNKVVLNGHTGSINSVEWSPDSSRLLSASSDNTAKVWNMATGKVQWTLTHSKDINRAVWSPDGQRIATASADNTAKIWDANTGQLIITLRGHSASVSSLIWSPDGKFVATVSVDTTGIIWDAASGEQLRVLSGHTADVNSVAWSRDGKSLLTASDDKTAIVWDAATGQPRFTLSGHNGFVFRATWSPDGSRIATASADKTAIIWDAKTGNKLFILAGHTRAVNRAVWSPDSKQLVTTSADYSARIWDTMTGTMLRTLFGHTNDVFNAAWSPGGSRLITVSQDRTARVWKAESGAELLTFTGDTEPIYVVAWAGDGRKFATAGADGSVRVWQIWNNQAALVQLAEDCCVSHPLTDEESIQFGLPIASSAAPPAVIATCEGLLPSRLYIGARGAVMDDDPTPINVRNQAGLSGTGVIAKLSPGQTFRVINGPQCADDIAWFQVVYGISADRGWIAEGQKDSYFIQPLP